MVDSGQWKLNAGVKLIKEGRNEHREARARLGGHVRRSLSQSRNRKSTVSAEEEPEVDCVGKVPNLKPQM